MALALDGHALGAWSSGSSFTVTLTTTSANDVIGMGVWIQSNALVTVSSISSTNTTGWTKRKQLTVNSIESTEFWVGTASAALTSEVITVHLSGTPGGSGAREANAFGVSGANTGSISDPNISLPATNTGNGSTPSVSGVSTSNANDFIICIVGADGTTTQTAGANFTLIDAFASSGTLATQDEIVSSTQSSIAPAFGTSQIGHWGMIVDAIQAASGASTLDKQSFDNFWDTAKKRGATEFFGSISIPPARTNFSSISFDPPKKLRQAQEWPQLASFPAAINFVPLPQFDAPIKLKRLSDWPQFSSVAAAVNFVPLPIFDSPAKLKQVSDWPQIPVPAVVVSYSGTTFDPPLKVRTISGWDQSPIAAVPQSPSLQSFFELPQRIWQKISEWWSGGFFYRPNTDILTDTTKLQLPINCVLAGQQGYEQGGYDIEDNAPNYSDDVKVSSGGGRLSDADSTFTTRTDKKGYD